MKNVNSSLNFIDNPEVELIKVQALKQILIESEGMVTPIEIGSTFFVNIIPMEGLKGLAAHYNGESFFVDNSEWSALQN